MADIHAHPIDFVAHRRRVRLPGWLRRIERLLAVRNRYRRRQRRRLARRDPSLGWLLALPQSRGNG